MKSFAQFIIEAKDLPSTEDPRDRFKRKKQTAYTDHERRTWRKSKEGAWVSGRGEKRIEHYGTLKDLKKNR